MKRVYVRSSMNANEMITHALGVLMIVAAVGPWVAGIWWLVGLLFGRSC